MQEIWLFALAFSFINVLEEIIWRGVLLSRFSEQLGDKWAVIVTSAGFGLQHYSLGFPWGVCIAFALGGLYLGGITIKSNSLIPVVVWHTWMNVLMIFSGLLL
ncbi:abortive infection protein [Paenibacillus sp. NAIST15-1]|nr:abortive infection protein [Paenibacillus sp. NAIST15-1]